MLWWLYAGLAALCIRPKNTFIDGTVATFFYSMTAGHWITVCFGCWMGLNNFAEFFGFLYFNQKSKKI
jgi:hypothetical protein